MTVKEKLSLDLNGLIEHGPITLVAFGDSVTHGALALGEINYATVYHRRLAEMLNARRSYVPVNVINAGIGGVTAAWSLARMEAQVFAHRPDLVIVCFGLNDVNGPLEEYLSSLDAIFTACLERGVDTVFMTPNMLNTYVAEDTAECHREYAAKTAEMQTGGRMDTYMNAAVALAKQKGIKVADCYAKWKKLAETEDVTLLLANRINHPTAEMHELFARTLYEVIMGEDAPEVLPNSDTMYPAK